MPDTIAEDLVAAFNAIFGTHDGTRAVHARGICCDATFTATPEAASLTRAPHMQGSPVRATVRFSHGSGKPDAHDSDREPVGMAVKFHTGERASTDIIAVNLPVFIVRTPEEFLEFVRLSRPDPATGLLDLAALGAFVGARPESMRAAQFLLAVVPMASFLTTEYFAIHAFRFVAADGTARFGRYRWEPSLAITNLAREEAKQRRPNYLREDLTERLKKAPGSFTLHVQLAGEGDDPNDPTTEWPSDRTSIVAGHIEITQPVSDQEGGCDRLLFDPTRLCDGIEASNDPILNIRPRAYAISFNRRAKRSA